MSLILTLYVPRAASVPLLSCVPVCIVMKRYRPDSTVSLTGMDRAPVGGESFNVLPPCYARAAPCRRPAMALRVPGRLDPCPEERPMTSHGKERGLARERVRQIEA